MKAASTCAIVQPHVPTGRRAPLRYTPWSKKCGSTRSASQYYLCPTSWKIAHRVRLQLCAGGRIAIDYPLVQTVSEVHLSGRCPNSSRGVVCCERIHPSIHAAKFTVNAMHSGIVFLSPCISVADCCRTAGTKNHPTDDCPPWLDFHFLSGTFLSDVCRVHLCGYDGMRSQWALKPSRQIQRS